jgi:hypothetical protein
MLLLTPNPPSSLVGDGLLLYLLVFIEYMTIMVFDFPLKRRVTGNLLTIMGLLYTGLGGGRGRI